MAVAGVDKQPSTVSPVNFPVCAFLFEPGQPPGSDKPALDGLTVSAILAARQRHCGHTDKQRGYGERKQFFHVRLLVTRVSPIFPPSNVQKSVDQAVARSFRFIAYSSR